MFHKEKLIIKQISHNNGYKIELIYNLITKTMFKILNRDNNNKKQHKYVPLIYGDRYSEQMIGNIFFKSHLFPGYN